MRKPLELLCVALCAASTASAQKPFPRGTVVVLQVGDKHLRTEPCWSDPNIIGVALRSSWAPIEENQGIFKWSEFDQGIALAQANNKFVVLTVSAVYPPQWVTAVVKTWKNSLGKTCPYPWDPNLQSYWNALIQAMGARYDGVSCVHGIDMWVGGTGGKNAGGTGIDCIFAPTAADCTALDAIAGGGTGSGNTLLTNALQALCAMYTAAFPTTPCFLHPGLNYYNLDPQSMSDTATWWLNLRSLNSLFNNEFNVNLPKFSQKLGFTPWPDTNLNIANINNGMFQDLDAIGRFKMRGQTLAEVFQNVHNVIVVQIYPQDPATDPGEQTIINFNLSVGL